MEDRSRQEAAADTYRPEAAGIQWHPGFYGAAEIEFISDKENLEFQREYNLSKEPVRIDLLVIRKRSDRPTENELGHIFRTYNIIEYKSPDDSLSIDDFFKTIGYACLYKGFGGTVNRIPAEELTVSMFRERYPRELFQELKNYGMEIEKRYPGIYYIHGRYAMLDAQIVVTRELEAGNHRSLRVLCRGARKEDVKAFVREAEKLREPGDRSNADAVLQVSVAANRELYEAVRKEEQDMCEALMELMKDEVEERERKAAQRAAQKATQKKSIELIGNLMETMNLTAEQAMKALKIPEEDRRNYMANL